MSLASDSGVGPFARLRAGASIDSGAYIGNFCELKSAHVGQGSNVCHLSYLGDADVGAQANIGAGTITCNYSEQCLYLAAVSTCIAVLWYCTLVMHKPTIECQLPGRICDPAHPKRLSARIVCAWREAALWHYGLMTCEDHHPDVAQQPACSSRAS